MIAFAMQIGFVALISITIAKTLIDYVGLFVAYFIVFNTAMTYILINKKKNPV